MKKLLSILLTVAVLFVLCACGSAPAPAQTAAPQPTQVQPAATPAAQTPAPADAPAPAETPEADVTASEDDADVGDGLNEYGLPDLSGFTAEEIWDMYQHPENWDASVLTMADSNFDFDDAAPYADEENDPDYVFDLGEWHDYDPGDWTPGPDEITQIETDLSGPDGDDTPGIPSGSDLPEEYAFLLPEGLRDGDAAMRDGGAFAMNLPGRTQEEFEALKEAAKAAGYTAVLTDMSVSGMQVYEVSDGSKTISMIYRSGTVVVSVE